MTLRLLAITILLSTTLVVGSQHLRELISGAETSSHASRKLFTCDIQQGVDYLGNDLMNVPNQPASACCNRCVATAGCTAWSWSDWNGGTCWLKTRKGLTALNPNVQSAEIISRTVPTCPILINVDYIGYDIANVLARPAGACCDVCKRWPGCNAFSWTSLNGGTCWLKSKKGPMVAYPNVQSGDVAGPPECVLEQGVDYYDHDIAHFSGYASPGVCCGVCLNWGGCHAFSWTALNGGTCWLKSRKDITKPDPNVVSCVLANPVLSCVQQNDVDYVDNDIASVPNGDADQCCQICRSYSGCNAFSWSDFNGGTCWLKSAKTVVVAKAGVISGVVI